MLGFRTSKERERYYLLAGMGGRAARRKRNLTLVWSLIVGVLVSFGLLAIFSYFDRLPVN